MILSASGWRKIFSFSQDEQDKSPQISENDAKIAVVAANVFFDYLCEKSGQKNPVIVLGIDTRPTGPAIADAMIRTLVKKGAIIQYSAVTSAPEIMAYAKKLDGFIYISASHNPIGHNGIKFGINDGGVLNAQENSKLVKEFLSRLNDEQSADKDFQSAYSVSLSEIQKVYNTIESSKHNALYAYKNFINETITGNSDKNAQNDFFKMLDLSLTENKIGVVCDFNGSSRSYCIDKDYFSEHKINFYSINEKEIVHEIIPEAENLVYVAQEMQRLQNAGHKEVILGYMPDCDGDRGNIVFWNEKSQKAEILKAQQVFSLSVLAELSYSVWKNQNQKDFKPAVAVNCPTSMRIEKIASVLGAKVFRAEVGEANVVNLAREKRNEGYNVRILGEGSNGGTITYPSAVRDPINTIFAIIKLLCIREKGPFELWCKKCNIHFKQNYSLCDILDTIPKFTTTGVSEPRAILHVKSQNHAELKKQFQKIFESEWNENCEKLKSKYSIESWECVITNGTKETKNVTDFSLSGKGGLKILFKNHKKQNIAFIWMRGSGTEPVFRIMCDAEGENSQAEKELLEWETKMIQKADNILK